MATINLFSIFLACFVIISPIQAHQRQGFTTHLIHRDSPLSPTYNPSITQWDRLGKAVQRSISRINHFRSFSGFINDIEAPVKSNTGEYLMEFALGTPPVKQLAIADTGSDLIWVQCQPCQSCYKQSQPIFDPRKSSTYKIQPCESKACEALSSEQGLCSSKNTCEYRYSYGDKSHTTGDLSAETLTFKPLGGDTINANNNTGSFPKVAFGCGHDNGGTFKEEGSGLIGLGGGPLSLVSQLSSTVGGKFSYCLLPFYKEGNLTSKISFGARGEVSGRGVLSTPLVKSTPETFYFLTLEGMTVGSDSFVQYKSPSSLNQIGGSEEEGNIIIDSGTTLTFVPQEFFDDFVSALDQSIEGEKVDDPSGTFQLCYKSNNGNQELNIPNVTAHFQGADVELKPLNTFVEASDGVVCLAMLPADQIAIFGNIAQVNFLVGYDIEGGTVSFKPTDCSKA